MIQLLCEDILKREEETRQPEKIYKRSRGISYLIDHLLISPSHASTSIIRSGTHIMSTILTKIRTTMRRQGTCRRNERNITNSDVLRLLRGNHPLARYNEKVQEEMDKLQNLLTEKIASRLKCSPDFIQSPDLFYSNAPELVKTEDENGVIHSSLPSGSGFSILPNSTNGVSVGNSIILSEPGGNVAFNEYMKEEYEKRGIIARFADTSLYAHTGAGNLHCATHTVYICQPRQTSQKSHQEQKK